MFKKLGENAKDSVFGGPAALQLSKKNAADEAGK